MSNNVSLVTSYISKLKDLPEDSYKFLITRFAPKHLDINKYNNLFLTKELAPKKEILLNYKQDNDWDKYTIAYLYQLYNDPQTHNTFNNLIELLKTEDKDIYLICYEKPSDNCHRHLIASELNRLGIKTKEY